MASQILRLNPADVILVAADDRVRDVTEYGSDVRLKRAGSNLVQISALVLAAGGTLGVVPVQTSERDLSALASGVALTVSGVVEAVFSGTDGNYGLKTTVYVQHLELTPVNAWSVLTETVRRAAQAPSK